MAKLPAVPHTRMNVRPLDIAILMWHLVLAAGDPEIGLNDADWTLEFIMNRLKPKRNPRIRTDGVESALYCCNLMDEAGKFWHPQGKSFDEFLRELLVISKRGDKYNKFYNYFEERKTNENR